MPSYPYDLPRADEIDVIDVDLVAAILGNTIEARRSSDGAAFRVDLADIRAPYEGQSWHSESVAALNTLVKGKRGRFRIFESIPPPEGMEELGVTAMGRLYVDGKDISWEMVGGGNAWAWEGKSNDPALQELQAWARENQVGLWALPASEREPPWEFLKRKMDQRMKQIQTPTPEQARSNRLKPPGAPSPGTPHSASRSAGSSFAETRT